MTTIAANLSLRLILGDEAALPVPTALSFDPSNAYAVRIVLTVAEHDVAWEFSREILDAGMRGEAGLGDVQVWAGHGPTGRTFIRLSSPGGTALLAAPTAELAEFMDRTYMVVPAGTECTPCLDDAALAAWLA